MAIVSNEMVGLAKKGGWIGFKTLFNSL